MTTDDFLARGAQRVHDAVASHDRHHFNQRLAQRIRTSPPPRHPVAARAGSTQRLWA
jgi:hypothetical protein